MNRTIIAQTPFGSDLLFKRMTGVEKISDLFEFDIVFVSKNANLQGNEIIGQPITLEIDTQTGGKRYLNGLATDFGYIGEDEDEEGYYTYTCIVRPFMWYLTQNVDSRSFVEKSVLDISKEVLSSFGFPYQIQCQKSYRTRGYCVQYQESSFNFLNRIFEQEGIYYYFKHTSDSHELIIVDDVNVLTSISGTVSIPYHSRQSTPGTPDIEYIDEWLEKDSLKSSQFITQDYNYKNAKVEMKASEAVHNFNSIDMKHYEFYTGFSDVSEAQNYSQVRSESLKSETKLIKGAGTALTLAPGHTFSLIKHPHYSSNTEYLLISTKYEFEEAGYTTGEKIGSFRISFRALPKSFQYRPVLKTLKPQVIGTQAATVTGPGGEEVYTNEYGDIKIQFHWDKYGQMNENSSGWVRVAQGSAGSGFGSINTPRVGEEVLVDFINGDVDRPIIIGRLYNSAMTPPWGFPSAAKQSGIKSKSFNSPLANYNELMFNDTAGAEIVNFQAQKDLTSLVKNNETRNVNNDRTTTIGNNETLSVTGERTKSIQKNETVSVAQNRNASVGQDESLAVTQNQSLNVGQSQSISVGKDQSVNVSMNRTRSVGQSEQISVGQSQALMIGQDQSVTVGKNQAFTVGANRNKTVTANEVSNIGGNRQETVTICSIDNVGAATVTNVGGASMLNVGGLSMTNVIGAETHIVGGAIALASGLHASMRSAINTTIVAGAKVTLRVGGSSITMSRGEIKISAKKITINGKRVVSVDSSKIHLN